MGLSFLYGPTASDEDRLAFLDHVYESGQRHWDTSDLYGDSEELLGKWFARSGKRAEIFLATKFGCVPTNPREIRSDPEYVQQAVERSLGRLGVETIDLYYVHRVDQKTPIEHTIKALVDLKDQGKIRYIGLSEVSAETLRRA
jgi:aryl-alcohol dehydrogenase-like predicted oxidoreductase